MNKGKIIEKSPIIKKGSWNPDKWGKDFNGESAIVGGFNWICCKCKKEFLSRRDAYRHAMGCKDE